MPAYKRILALVDIGRNGEAVVRRAAPLAASCHAELAVAGIVDYAPGFECDHVPFRTPQQMRMAIVRDVTGKLDEMVRRIGCRAEVIVAADSERQAVADLSRSWRPDLVLVGSHAPHGLLEADSGNPGFDVLTVRAGKRGLAGRFVQALAAAI